MSFIVSSSFKFGGLEKSQSHILQTIRFATKKAGGSTKNGRDSPGQRLGVKKFGGEYAISGNILIRQRGHIYKSGVNTMLGRDFTLFAVAPGYVKFDYNKEKKHHVVSIVQENPNPPPYFKKDKNVVKRHPTVSAFKLPTVSEPVVQVL